jgi:hypothetical protein
MVYGSGWTAKRVATRLVAAFQRLPNTPIYAATRSSLEPVEGPIDGLDLIVLTGVCLGRESPERLELLTYARALAMKRVLPICREKGWSRATLYRHIEVSAATVAECLNERHRYVAYETQGGPSPVKEHQHGEDNDSIETAAHPEPL